MTLGAIGSIADPEPVSFKTPVRKLAGVFWFTRTPA